jgi:small GTP-binding protein
MTSVPKVRAVVVGDSACGKTSLVTRFVENAFYDQAHRPTIGLEYRTKTVYGNSTFSTRQCSRNILSTADPDDENANEESSVEERSYEDSSTPQLCSDYAGGVTMEIWDIAGQSNYFSIVRSYFRDCDVVFFVFDVTRPPTFKSLDEWKKRVDSETTTRAALSRDNNNVENGDQPGVPCVLVANKSDMLKIPIDEHMLRAYARKAMFDACFITSAKSNACVVEMFTFGARLAARYRSSLNQYLLLRESSNGNNSNGNDSVIDLLSPTRWRKKTNDDGGGGEKIFTIGENNQKDSEKSGKVASQQNSTCAC